MAAENKNAKKSAAETSLRMFLCSNDFNISMKKIRIFHCISSLKNDIENQNFAIFEQILKNVGRSDTVKKRDFQ